MSEIVTEKVSVTTTGSAGSATGSGTTGTLMGYLLDVYLDYHASCPDTADVTVTDAVFGTMLTVSNNTTDGWYAPLINNVDSTGAAITGVYSNYPLNGNITISVADADALVNCLVAYVRYLRV